MREIKLMKVTKITIFIFAIIFEVLFLGICWMLVFIHRPTAKRLTTWALENLPSKDWYYE